MADEGWYLPKFDSLEDERRHRKERLAAALRLFGRSSGSRRASRATSPPAIPSTSTTSG